MDKLSVKEIRLIKKMIDFYWEQHNNEHIDNKKDWLKTKELVKKLIICGVVSSKILIDKKELLELTTKAIKEGFNTYEIVDSGLESFDADDMARWIISKYI